MSTNILIVCTGNTCRSVMAAALLEDAIDKSDIHKSSFDIESAGTFACEGQEPTAKAIAVMEELGLDISRHKAQQVDEKLVRHADLILTMEAGHIEQLEAMFPSAESKMHTIMGFVKDVAGFPGDYDYDVADPYDEPIEDYRACAKELSALMPLVLKKLIG